MSKYKKHFKELLYMFIVIVGLIAIDIKVWTLSQIIDVVGVLLVNCLLIFIATIFICRLIEIRHESDNDD